MASRSFFFWLPVSHATCKPSGVSTGSNQPISFRKCCSAKISVGAIKAHCHPASMHWAAARAATTVLPEPTSPCSKRCMGCGRSKSWEISATTLCWAWVKANGNAACKAVNTPAWFCALGKRGARKAARSRLDCHCDNCWANNSSALSLCQAGWLRSSSWVSDTLGAGWCKNCKAWANGQVWAGACPVGIVSLKAPCRNAWAKPPCTALRKYAWGMVAVLGYTGVKAVDKSPPAACTAGCMQLRPMKPPRTSPRKRTWRPTSNAFCILG